jgi:hypothetical protein
MMQSQQTPASFWDFNRALTQRLLTWAGVSLAVGLGLLVSNDPRRGGVGSQFAGWALVNAAIALVGGRAAEGKRRQCAAGELPEAETVAKEARNLRRLLWVNAGLDVLYVLGGLLLRQKKARTDLRWQGVGEGIALQGAALFIFDIIHALLMPEPEPASPGRRFDGS